MSFFSIFIAWPILATVAIDLVRRFTKKEKTERRPKLSKREDTLQDKLSDYLTKNDKVKINDNIYLKPTRQDKDLFAELGVFFHGEYVCQLLDFRAFDMDTYQTILDSISFDNQVKEEPQADLKAEVFIEKINEYNTEIEHKEISNYLYISASMLTNISVLEEKGACDPRKTRKLYMYYLPILMDILDNYCKMKDNRYVADDVKAMEEKLIKTIILCNEALETLLESLNDEDVMNMSVNMNTLESILKKDGLIKEAGMEKIKESVR